MDTIGKQFLSGAFDRRKLLCWTQNDGKKNYRSKNATYLHESAGWLLATKFMPNPVGIQLQTANPTYTHGRIPLTAISKAVAIQSSGTPYVTGTYDPRHATS